MFTYKNFAITVQSSTRNYYPTGIREKVKTERFDSRWVPCDWHPR